MPDTAYDLTADGHDSWRYSIASLRARLLSERAGVSLSPCDLVPLADALLDIPATPSGHQELVDAIDRGRA